MRQLLLPFLLLVAQISLADPPRLEKYVDPLPAPPVVHLSGSDFQIQLKQFNAQFHRDLPPTKQWGYGGISPGPTLEVESGHLVRVHWKNALPKKPLFPEARMHHHPGLPEVRSVTHLHGAVVSEYQPLDKQKNNDGWPDAWNVPGGVQIAEYPNQQQARTLWYHDHAMGVTAKNMYSGLAGMYLIRDAYERSLNLPQGKFEIPLIFQARGFDDHGALFYPSGPTMAEFYGNTVTVNGKLWPYLSVEPRKYRFRILNASTARSLAIKLLDVSNQSPGPAFFQIGSDSGFLENTVLLNDPSNPDAPRLDLAPSERADVVIDFSKDAGRTFLLQNNSLTDTGDGELPVPELMIVKVGTQLSQPDMSSLPLKMRPIEKLNPAAAAQSRNIVLGQATDSSGMPMLLLNGKQWNDPISDKPVLGSTEIWQLINTLPDLHPFHIHLVQFQVLDRTPYDVDRFVKTGQLVLTGPSLRPDPGEAAWKDTVRALPGQVTRIIMRFAPYAGYYVYHCHIAEHEDMGMMRPFQVVQP